MDPKPEGEAPRPAPPKSPTAREPRPLDAAEVALVKQRAKALVEGYATRRG